MGESGEIAEISSSSKCKNGELKIHKRIKGSDRISVLRTFFEGLRENNISKVQKAISSGVDVNAVNYHYCFPLLIAAKNGSSAMVELLLKSGADVNMKEKLEGLTPLHAACQMGQMKTIDLLLTCTTDVDVQTNTGTTPLHFACWYGAGGLSTVKKLLKIGANADIPDVDGQTPLMIASQQGLARVVNALLVHGAKVDLQDSTGLSALHYACIKPIGDNAAVISTLLQYRSNIDSADKENHTALHVACQDPDAKIIQMLLNKGTNVNARDYQGKTPLHLVIKFSRSADIIDHLLDKGAQINAVDSEGNTPLHLAAQLYRVCQMEKLLERGALISCRNYSGKSPYDLASHRAGNVCRPREVLAAHIMKCNLAGLLLFDANYRPDHVTHNLQLCIQQEFDRVKFFKVTEHFSLKEVLACLNSPYYLKNSDIVSVLEKFMYSSDEQFPLFSYILKNVFELSKTRFRLLGLASQLCFWRWNRLILDNLVVQRILMYLTNEDLQNLISSVGNFH